MKLHKVRQTFKKQTISLLLAILGLPLLSHAQTTETKIDYSIKSNILDPDTLTGDRKVIFWHFVDLSSQEAKDLPALEMKEEFEKIGITTDQRNRFVAAYTFFRVDIKSHKISVEQWQHFIYLKPKNTN